MLTLDKIKQLPIPTNPGSYQFCAQGGEVIYIGKAVNLQQRVYSYWQNYDQLTLAKQQMVEQIDQVKWIETSSEIEALLLEANLIKKHQPRYNIVWRDDKRYCYIAISPDQFPRVYWTRQLVTSGQFFGPFTNLQAVRQTLKTVRKIWPYRSCRQLPSKICLYYRLNQCPGPCQQLVTVQDYQKNIQQISLFLNGKKQQVIKDLQAEIKLNQTKLMLGQLAEEQQLFLAQRIQQIKWQIQQLEVVLANVQVLGLADKYTNDIVELAKVLSLPKVPQRIEGYDVSGLSGRLVVGSMVVFIDGEACPSQYKRFKLKEVGQNHSTGDIVWLKEMISRRLAHQDWPLPDLMVIDGAKAQVNLVKRLLDQAKIDLPVIGLGKDNGLRSARALDRLYFPNQQQPLQLSLNSPALHVLKRIRDEAHRFALSYHHYLRCQKILNK